MRYRLRLLLQEIDLPHGATILGRSADANLTIEDPLVSRLHARIVIDETGGRVEDLESRNGVRVNGLMIRRPTKLSDGDRVRLGTQDLIFCRVEQGPPRYNKTTGVLRLCANCKTPYPREMVACPNCEATEQLEEQTLQGEEPTHDKSVWGTQLLVEALERAVSRGRTEDAERIARRATSEVDARFAAGGPLDGSMLADLATHASLTALATGDPAWALWGIDAYCRANLVPPAPVVRAFGQVAAKHPGAVRASLRRLIDHVRLRGEAAGLLSAADGESLARLEELHRGVEVAASVEPETSGPDDTGDVSRHWSERP